ncbi:bark storage protein A-like [Corylus avellana]|uniref:bark storage protein A-like n=1 Tax=Corylus avellana TaxID=13451 RepID=UPI00286B932C|nr:bark storage protein A-like [Corylus avellana]
MTAKLVRKCLVLLVLVLLLVVPAFSFPLKRRKSLNVIKEINHEGPYLGLVTVYPPEENAFFATGIFKPQRTVDLSGRRFLVGKIHEKKVIYVRCGVGMVNAAVATQQMLDLFDIKGIVHFGIAGNLNDSLSIGDVSIPKQIAHTGIWGWQNPKGKLDPKYVSHMDVASYNVPKGNGSNLLGRIGYRKEEFFTELGKPNAARPLVWAQISQHWLHLAHNLKKIELEGCVNSSLCLPRKPKLVVGLRGSTANIFVDNAAYRNFLVRTFQVSSADMESSAVVMTSLSNGFPVIVIRGLSDLAGGQPGENAIGIFRSLAALNAAKVVAQFIKALPHDTS